MQRIESKDAIHGKKGEANELANKSKSIVSLLEECVHNLSESSEHGHGLSEDIERVVPPVKATYGIWVVLCSS